MAQHRRQIFAWILVLMALFITGCSHALSLAVRQQIDTTLSMTQLHADPERYKDRVVMLGGEIIAIQNLADGTRIEMLHTPLDGTGMPYGTDRSEGRFMAQCDTYLDPAIYASGRQLTVAGGVFGSYLGKIGEAEYVYPRISCLEIRLWPQRTIASYPTYSFWPWWAWGPWPRPFWWRPYSWHYRHHW